MMSKLQLKLIQKESTQVMEEKKYVLRQDMVHTKSEQHKDQPDQVNLLKYK